VAGNATIAAAQIDMYNRLTAVWATLGQATTGAIDVEALLPEDLSAKFRARMEPEYEAIIAALVAGNAAVAAALLDRFNAQLAAWASLGQTITKITTEIADLGDPSTAIANWQLVSAQLERTAARAKTAFDAAIASGDVERIAKASVAYHDAVLARLQAEREMVANIEAAIQAILTQAATLVATVTQIATLDIGTGALGTVNALLGALEGMATSGPPAARQLWAVGQAIQAIIAVLPAAIAQFGALQTATDWLRYGVQTAAQLQAIGPNQISRAVVTGAAPFLAVQQTAIDAATGGAKLTLLQEQAAAWTALANAAIAGVNQWAQQAIAGARAAADTVIEGLRKEKDAKLAAIDAQIAGVQKAEAAAQKLRRSEMEALTDQISKAQEFEAAVKRMGEFIQSLTVGPLGPGNPADKLASAQTAFAAALQAYTAHPTAAGLTDLQGLAQTMLGLAEPIFTKPSPQFQLLSATTIKQLLAAQALAAAAVTDSEVLKQQLATLKALDAATTQGIQDQIAALEAQKKSITDDFTTQTTAIEAAFTTQKAAIEQAARDEIAGINAGLATALKDNAAAQAPLIQEALDKQDALLAAVTRGAGAGVIDGVAYLAERAKETVDVLKEIRDGVNAAVGHQAGAWETRAGFALLHAGEMVVPRAPAAALRQMMGTPGATAAGTTSVTASAQGAVSASGPLTIVITLDGKTIGEATLPTILRDARSGKMHTVIVNTTRSA